MMNFYENIVNFGKKLKVVSKKKKEKKEFDSETGYKEKYLKAKIKSYKRKISTSFHNNKTPEEGYQFICLSVSLIDSVFRTDKTYYPQVVLDKCKYAIK